MSLWKFLLLKTKNKEDGFTLVLILGIGLFMLITGVAAIKMSSNSEVNSKVQEKTQQSLAAAELGLARFQEALDNNRPIAVYPSCKDDENRTDADGDGIKETCPDTGTVASWANFTALEAKVNEGTYCQKANPNDPFQSYIKLLSTTKWFPVDSKDASKGEYRLVKYTYAQQSASAALPGVGTLEIEGRAGAGAINTGVTRLKVEIPIRENVKTYSSATPGLWTNYGSNLNMGQNLVIGNILVSDPGCLRNGNSGTKVTDANIVPGTGELKTTSQTIPDTPDLPPLNKLNRVTAGELTDKNTTFPRSTDVIYNGAYHYLVPDLDAEGGSGIKVSGANKMILYVQGNITLNGNINDKSTRVDANGNPIIVQPDSLQIYGNTTVGTGKGYNGSSFKYGCDDPQTIQTGNDEGNPRCPTLKIRLTGTANVLGFVQAPEASGCVTGGGSDKGGGSFKGAIWINAWDTSQTSCQTQNKLVIEYTEDAKTEAWTALGFDQEQTYDEPQIAPLSSWERTEVK